MWLLEHIANLSDFSFLCFSPQHGYLLPQIRLQVCSRTGQQATAAFGEANRIILTTYISSHCIVHNFYHHVNMLTQVDELILHPGSLI